MGPKTVLGGRYELGPAIGSGGFGTVFRARDRKSGADVAIKIVVGGLGSEPAAQRLRREGQLLRRVASRHVARVYDSGDDDHGVWLVTELVDGAPLTVTTLGRPLLPHEVLRVARGLLEGLAAVHSASIVHGDVKPSNVLAPNDKDRALDGVKLVDFGLARIVSRSEVAASIGDAMTKQGTVLGTARYMAPEVLTGGEPTMRSDLYSAGLVLFELLDDGPLFPVGDGRAQLRARCSNEPTLRDRVPEPLSDVLARMLARDPNSRWDHAATAYEAVADLDTAPVSVVRTDSLPPSARTSVPPLAPIAPLPGLEEFTQQQQSKSRSTAPPAPVPAPAGPPPSSRAPAPPPSSRAPAPPPSSRSPISTSPPIAAPPSSRAPISTSPPLAPAPSPSTVPPMREVVPPARTSTAPPPSVRPSSEARRRHPSSPPIARLTSLPQDGVVALRETLRHLDLPMLDALARRERGNPIGRIARAVALALRLELDAAALILEPLAMQSDVARAIGAAILAPRARRVTRARVDSDREDKWVDTIDPELGAMLVSLSAALAMRDDAGRDADRCARALARLEKVTPTPALDSTRSTLKLAQAAARVRKGELDQAAGFDSVTQLMMDTRGESPFHIVLRALSVAVLSQDESRASAELERAERIAAETGTTLLDASSATALGMMLVSISPRNERGLLALERASTLLAHGDAPSLEHEAEQYRATILIALNRWREAIVHLRAAREAAHAERAGELAVLSAALQAVAELATGDLAAALESTATIGDQRLASMKGRSAGLAWVARALTAFTNKDHDAAEDALAEAESRVRDPDRKSADVYVLVEILGMLFDAARGALNNPEQSIAGLERFAEESGFEGFYWLDLVAAILAHLPDAVVAKKMTDVLARLAIVLGPKSRLARERRTDAPPPLSTRESY